MIALILHNLLAYSEQIAILIAIAALLSTILKLTASARLHGLQLLLAACVALPFLQPWRIPAAKSAVTVTTTVLSNLTPSTTAPDQWQPSMLQVIAAVLAAGILVRLTLLGLGMVRLRRYIDRARLIPSAFRIEKERIGVWPDILASDELRGPVTFGLFRPAILIPSRWITSETVAYHELIHVQRRDWAFTVVEEFIRALLWFHPGVWWLIGQIQLAREEVVDRKVVQLMQSRERYLDTLLAIAEAKAGLDLAPAPLFLKKRHLRQRVAALLKEVNMSRVRIRSSLAGFAAVLAVASWMATRSFPLEAAPQVRDAPGVTVHVDESKLLHRAAVRYPVAAMQKGIQGTVVVEATLDQNGEVTDAQVLSGPQELRNAALESILKWHYDKDSGIPAKVQIAIDFALPAGEPKSPASTPFASTAITRIEMGPMSEALRNKVAAQLQLQIGDQISSSDIANLNTRLSAIDEHLRAGAKPSRDGNGVMLAIGLSDGPVYTSAEPAVSPIRIRVGGNVQAVNLINKVTPTYPPDAKQARVQGTVRFTATIGKDGHILNLDLVSGHPLLVPAAQEAVQQWVYKPTLLNGNPVEVITQIDVNFTLSQ